MEFKEKVHKSNYLASDEEIVKRVLGGEIDSYEILMRRYNQRLFRIGHAYLKDEDEIEDSIQSAYLKAYEQLKNFQHRSGFSTWLIRIFINEMLARMKKKERFRNYIDSVSNESKVYDTSDPGGPVMSNPYNSTINNELKNILEKAVSELPEKYRTVFIMREIEEMSLSEISKCLGISEVNVKVRVSRAKHFLRESLSGYYHNRDIYSFHLSKCSRIVDNVLNSIKTKYRA